MPQIYRGTEVPAHFFQDVKEQGLLSWQRLVTRQACICGEDWGDDTNMNDKHTTHKV